MPRVFVAPHLLEGQTASIEGPAYHHLARVLRVRVGDSLTLLDGLGTGRHAEVVAVDRHALTVRLLSPVELPPPPPVRITVAQAIGKGDRFEQALTHATEAGATAFIPLITERTVVRLDAADEPARLARWRAIVTGAAEQSGRACPPPVHAPARLETVLGTPGHVLLLHPGGEPLHVALQGGAAAITVCVGPEGGFSDGEVSRAREASAVVASLGPYVLRTETAAVVAVSQVLLTHALRGATLRAAGP